MKNILFRSAAALFLLSLFSPLFSSAGQTEKVKSDRFLHPSSIPLEEKIAQILVIAADIKDIDKAEEAVKKGVGSVQLQWGSFSKEDTKKITSELQALAELSRFPPLFIGTDYEGGSVYVPTTLGLLELPTNMMLGAADDANKTSILFYLAGEELMSAGINAAYGPVLDINTNPENPIIGIRSLGSDPYRTARLGAAIIDGFKAAGVFTAAKHFPGHGAADKDTHKDMPVINMSERELMRSHLIPFKAAIKAGVPAVMTAHILFPPLDKENPATLSGPVLNGLLRERLGYRGLIMTDSLDMGALTKRTTIAKAAAGALKAGADILLTGQGDIDKVVKEIKTQIKSGEIPEKRLDEAYMRVIKAKINYKLFNAGPGVFQHEGAYKRISRELSSAAVTLVRDGKEIPVGKNKKISVFIFAPQRFASNALTLYTELSKSYGSVKYHYYDIQVQRKDYAGIIKEAEESDILLVGSFQWAAAQNISQKEIIGKLLNTGKDCILLSLMSPYDINNFPQAGTVLALYGITESTMRSAGKILSGEIKASGLMPVAINYRPGGE